MRVERLQNLVRVLREVEDRGLPFDMEHWFEDFDSESCGTAACALGWATRDPWMESEGLGATEGYPSYLGAWGFGAAASFFEISLYDARVLFNVGDYVGGRISAAQVRERVEELLSGQPPARDRPSA